MSRRGLGEGRRGLGGGREERGGREAETITRLDSLRSWQSEGVLRAITKAASDRLWRASSLLFEKFWKWPERVGERRGFPKLAWRGLFLSTHERTAGSLELPCSCFMVQRESLSRTLSIQSDAPQLVRAHMAGLKFIWLFPCVRERPSTLLSDGPSWGIPGSGCCS